MGKASLKEKVVAYVFIFTGSLWILRKNLNESFNLSLNDTLIGILGALLLLLFLVALIKRNVTTNKIQGSSIFGRRWNSFIKSNKVFGFS